MNQDMRTKSLVVGIAVVSLFVGITAGFIAAHRVMGDMSGMQSSGEMKGHEMDGMSMEGMKGMPMEGAKPMRDMEPMPGVSDTPSGAVAVPAGFAKSSSIRSGDRSAKVNRFSLSTRRISWPRRMNIYWP